MCSTEMNYFFDFVLNYDMLDFATIIRINGIYWFALGPNKVIFRAQRFLCTRALWLMGRKSLKIHAKRG